MMDVGIGALGRNKAAAGSSIPKLIEQAWLPIALAVVALQGALVLTHEPWLDEWQAIQIVVQSPSLEVFFYNLKYEGHPPLWYGALWIAAQFAGPYGALTLAALLCSLSSQYLLLFKSGLPHLYRLGFALSAIVLFEYNTISRSYTLGVTLLFFMMVTWDRKWLPWIPIILLPALEFLFGLFSIIFIILRIRDGKFWLWGAVIWLAVSIFSAITVIPAPDNVPAFLQANTTALSDLLRYLFQISSIIFTFAFSNGRPEWDSLAPFYSFMVLWPLFLGICLAETDKFPLLRLLLIGFAVSLGVFFVFVSPLAIRHTLLLGLLLILFQWRMILAGHRPGAWFKAWLGLQAVLGVSIATLNLMMPFHAGRLASEYIVENNLQQAHWSVFPRYGGLSVSALTGTRFERAGFECMQDVVRWNEQDVVIGTEGASEWLAAQSGSRGRFYFLSPFPLPRIENVRKIAQFDEAYDGWVYRIYEVNPDQPLWQSDLPSCTPDMQVFSTQPAIRSGE